MGRGGFVLGGRDYRAPETDSERTLQSKMIKSSDMSQNANKNHCQKALVSRFSVYPPVSSNMARYPNEMDIAEKIIKQMPAMEFLTREGKPTN